MFKKFYHFRPVWVIIFLAVFSIFHYGKNFNELPLGPHIWAQADRYAIAKGFLNNHFNFFLPQTYNLAPALSPDKPLKHREGISRADFPIHSYIVALAMKISGISTPLLFRLYTLLYSLTGLFFLFLFIKKLTRSHLKTFFVLTFTLTTPAFTFYQSGTLPTIPSVANIFIALWFYYKFSEQKKYRFFYLAVAFLTLAALPRLHFIIFLIAFSGYRSLVFFRQKKIIFKEVSSFFIAFGILLINFLYNSYLEHRYGSIFLSALASPDSVKDFISILKILATDNFYCYTTPVHLFVSLSSLGILILNIKSLKDNFPGAYGIISLTGALMVFILMESQFIYHDYYFLDTLFPVMVLIVIYAIGKLPDTNTNWGKVCAIAMLIMLPFMIWLNNTALAKNYSAEAEDKQKIIRQNFSNTESFLKASGVTDTSTILVIDACSANYPFVLMNKKGYSLIYSEADFKKIPDLMSANPDFIILQHNFILSGILTYYPQIISGIKKISDNGKIAIFRRSNRDSVKTIPDFLAINNFQINYHSHTDFDANTNPPFWENIHPTRDNNAFSGKFSGLLDSTIEFSATLKIPAKNLLKPNNQKALIDIHFKSVKKFNGCYMVLSVEDDQKNLFYFSEDIGNNFINQNWARYFCIIPFPDLEKNANAVIKIYLWNKNRNHIRYDNFSVAIIDKDYLK